VTTAQPSPDDPSSPDPATTPGLEPGGGVSPGDTPPGEGSMSGTSPDAHQAPNQGPVSGNRTPMIIALTALAVVVVMVAVLTGASFFAD
jgi:hypothetical protein